MSALSIYATYFQNRYTGQSTRPTLVDKPASGRQAWAGGKVAAWLLAGPIRLAPEIWQAGSTLRLAEELELHFEVTPVSGDIQESTLALRDVVLGEAAHINQMPPPGIENVTLLDAPFWEVETPRAAAVCAVIRFLATTDVDDPDFVALRGNVPDDFAPTMVEFVRLPGGNSVTYPLTG